MGQKNLKGSVSVSNNDNRIRLRWRHLSKRYSLNLFQYNKLNLIIAKEIAVSIERDLINGTFDPTLARYTRLTKPDTGKIDNKEIKSLVQLFEEWVKEFRNMDCNKHIDYYAARNMLKRWGEFEAYQAVHKLGTEAINERTYNRRLTLLKNFYSWLKKQKIIPENYLEDVQRKKVKKKPCPQRKPFTKEEISKILGAFKTNCCCPKYSRFRHSHYYPFVYFLFKTGVRNAEAVGLRVKHIHEKKKIIEISEVLARSLSGTHAKSRVRKETKNEKIRHVPLTEDLRRILLPLIQNKRQDDLIFVSPNGLSIDDKMFQRRIFRPILNRLNIAPRVLYACRHTFGSRCIEAGITPVMTAFLMGNNPETALRNYVHQISLPSSLPTI